MNRCLFLIDSSAVAYRSFYAFINNPLVNSRGEQTSAIYGYAAQVLRILQQEQPSHIAILKDLRGPTFRHEIFGQYKATRKPMPDELAAQFPVIDEFIENSGIVSIGIEGFEADDLMGTLVHMALNETLPVLLVTKDKDMMQLVSDKVRLYEPGGKNQPPLITGPEEVFNKFGVGPGKIIDLLSLMGDASDNIPGVRKVGPKTAAQLLEQYGSLEGVYENLGGISRAALRENLITDRENAFLSRRLVTLNCGVPLKQTINDLEYRPPDAGRLASFLKHWELHSLLQYVQEAPPLPQARVSAHKPQAAYRLFHSDQDRQDLIQELEKAPLIALDTETTGLDSLSAGLVGLCLSTAPETGWYIPLGHHAGPNTDIETCKKILGPFLFGKGKRFVFHNAKFDLPILERFGLAPFFSSSGDLLDTMVAAYLLNPGARGISLDALAESFLGYTMIPIESLIGKKGKNQRSFAEVPVEEACPYGAEDADITLRLWQIFEKKLSEAHLTDLFLNLEMKLLPVLQKMEMRGICLNQAALAELSVSMAEDIAKLEKEIYRLAGGEFNIESPQQLGTILFDTLGLKKGKKTKTGFSTDAAVLTGLKGSHPIVDSLLAFREAVKLKNTYVDVLPLLVKDRTQRIHTSYSQTIAATGRLSSISPNLQNIPIRTSEGKKIRACFVPQPGPYVLLAADYSQIELRMLAHLSGDPDLKSAYRTGADIHTLTAAALYDIEEGAVTGDQRRSAKVVNFGILYGMGATRLSRELDISRDQASRFIENYFGRYSGVRPYMRGVLEHARQQGYVETISGRRRYLPELISGNTMLRMNAERMAVNTPIQGSAADLIKQAMIDLDRKLSSAGLDCEMLLQVHDELVFEVSEKDLDRSSALIKHTMEHAMELTIPLVADMGSGKTWLEAHG